MLNHKSEGMPRHSTMQTFTTPCVPHPVRWCWWNLNGRNPEFANHWAWRWSKATSTLFPDSPSNDSSLKASKARNHSCHGCQWACFRVSTRPDSSSRILWSCIISDGRLGRCSIYLDSMFIGRATGGQSGFLWFSWKRASLVFQHRRHSSSVSFLLSIFPGFR